VVVAACTPRTHEALFQETMKDAGLNKYLFEMANIRNQCSWVHSQEKEAATEKAMDLVKMAVARARLIQPSAPAHHSHEPHCPGDRWWRRRHGRGSRPGGPGVCHHLVERSPELGGNALMLNATWQGEQIGKPLAQMVDRVKSHPEITLLTNADIRKVDGFVGNFETEVNCDGEKKTIRHGIVIVATGGREYQPVEYSYGQDKRVMTHQEMDAAMREDAASVHGARSVVFIQCVGSREPERPWCSKVCCTHTMKSALRLKEMDPDKAVYVLYRDIRTYGQRERLYREAREKGVLFIRYEREAKPDVKPSDEDLAIQVHDPVLGRDVVVHSDLLVLASAIVPGDNSELAQMLKLPLNEDGFYTEAHAKLRPVEFATEGVFLAGLAHYPKPLEESITQAQAAASRAAVALSRDSITVEGVVSGIDAHQCWGCGKCEAACPYNAIELKPLEEGGRVSYVHEALCKGCGACAVVCPTGAASVRHYHDGQILTMMDAMLA
jgi:heterodisulfide reductase subunit A